MTDITVATRPTFAYKRPPKERIMAVLEESAGIVAQRAPLSMSG
jgi:hypothetical protein